MPLKIEPINRSHDRRNFNCGNAELNHYLQNTARQQSEKGISRTFVLIDSENPLEILGFFTLAACEILLEKLPPKFAKKYPRCASAAKLARLAVASHRHKQGIGVYMMLNAMERVFQVAEHLGVMGFFVDAKDDVAAGDLFGLTDSAVSRRISIFKNLILRDNQVKESRAAKIKNQDVTLLNFGDPFIKTILTAAEMTGPPDFFKES